MGARIIELAPQIYRVPTFPFDGINSFCFVETDGSVTLVDCGLKGAPRKLVAALAELGKAPSDVRRIVLTHTHADHAGGAAAMRTTTAAPLAVHDDDAAYPRSGKSPPRETRFGQLLAALPGGGFPAVSPDETFGDGDRLDIAGGVLVVHTPGHTPGHVSFLHEASGVLITGDAVFNAPRMMYPPRAFCTSHSLTKETAARLGELDYEVAAFTHGPEIREGARDRVREFLKRR